MSIKQKIIDNWSKTFPKLKADKLMKAIFKEESKKEVWKKYCQSSGIDKRKFLAMRSYALRAKKVKLGHKVKGFYIPVGWLSGVPCGAVKVDIIKEMSLSKYKFILHKHEGCFIVSEYTTGFMVSRGMIKKTTMKNALLKLKQGEEHWTSHIKSLIKINN